jgi:hypothetical protein
MFLFFEVRLTIPYMQHKEEICLGSKFSYSKPSFLPTMLSQFNMLKHALCHPQQKQKAAEVWLINHFLRQKDCLGI